MLFSYRVFPDTVRLNNVWLFGTLDDRVIVALSLREGEGRGEGGTQPKSRSRLIHPRHHLRAKDKGPAPLRGPALDVDNLVEKQMSYLDLLPSPDPKPSEPGAKKEQ